MSTSKTAQMVPASPVLRRRYDRLCPVCGAVVHRREFPGHCYVCPNPKCSWHERRNLSIDMTVEDWPEVTRSPEMVGNNPERYEQRTTVEGGRVSVSAEAMLEALHIEMGDPEAFRGYTLRLEPGDESDDVWLFCLVPKEE